ncbi:MAG: hypothetical protein C4293_17175 [Nitrospiraceae bacterium]
MEELVSLLRNGHGGIGILLALLVVALALFVGYHGLLKQRQIVSQTHSLESSVPTFAAQRAQLPADPSPQSVQIPVSSHASTLTAINQMIEQGKYGEAEAGLQALPAEALADLAVRINVATLWNNLGVGQAKTGGARAGVSGYKTAISINPRNSRAFMNLVLAYWELKDPALTADMLEEAMRLDPQEPLPHLILAERSIEKDDLATAAAHLGHAKARIAGSPKAQAYFNDLIVYVQKTKKAEQTFIARESAHFTVKYDGGEEYAVWTRVLAILEDAYRDIGQQLGHFPAKPILVVLHTREQFHDATGGPAWSDGLYDPTLGRIKIPTQGALTDQAWLTRVLRHEFVHALLHDRTGGRRIPQWLNEGLAMQLAAHPRRRPAAGHARSGQRRGHPDQPDLSGRSVERSFSTASDDCLPGGQFSHPLPDRSIRDGQSPRCA